MAFVQQLALFGRWHVDDRDVRVRHFTTQREHLVHSDPGSDRCIPQARLPYRFLHPGGSDFSDVSKHCSESLFSLGYSLSFTVSDGAHCVSGYTVNLGDLIHARVGLGQ